MTQQSTSKGVSERDLRSLCQRLDPVFAEMSGSELLITGGAGFLGYYLVQAPLAWNRENPARDPIRVTVHDRYLRGVPTWLTRLDDGPHLRVRERDVLAPLTADDSRFDYIVHAASIASPTYYRQHTIETMDANVGGLRNLLDHAAARADGATPVRGLLYLSTSEIYGDPDPDDVPTPETYRGFVSSTGPRACYDESKRYGETLSVNFAQRGVPVSIVRPFNNYGPGLRIDDGRVVPDFAADVLAGRDITMLSDGSARRTFCYIEDAVDGYFRVLTRGRRGEPYNIGADQPEISIRSLGERMAGIGHRLTGYRGQVVTATSEDRDYLTDNPNRRCPVIDKARSELGYEPQVDLEDGLERALRWYLEEQER